ncbi:branched-chain amino acid ABC transporter permease [Pollutimonas nitritireducens]|nr:branched-chain amino acid ABC transporter permease [Pollutimonas nitritireducens]
MAQTTNGLIVGMLLFLVASGLSLIFGVLKVINFTHGSLYMMGAFASLYVYRLTDNYFYAVIGGTAAIALFGVLLERLFISRVYKSDILMQLLVCYAWILILDDFVTIVFGAEFQSLGMPETFAVPPVFVFDTPVPPFYIFLITISFAVAVGVWLFMEKSAFGRKVRAAAANSSMTSVLGINTTALYAIVFAVGAALAGFAGALAAPVRSLTSGMGFSILIESFIVTVIGGLGSIIGALVAGILIGLVRSFGSVGFPLFVDGLVFLMMAVVLVIWPNGLFGKRGT